KRRLGNYSSPPLKTHQFSNKTVWEYVIPDFAEYPAPLNEFIVGSHNSCFRAHRYKPEGVSWLR
ncbi:MAG: hypothetical protein NZ878_02690, partial [SAR324 cluster bacterium]|nr:hypothetical protein [SAR324 cluster bacterium]